MNLEGYKTILPTNIQENASRFIGKCFILDQDNDPKHPPSPVKAFIRAKKGKVLDCPSQSPELNPIEHECHQPKRRVKAETPQNKQQLELAALKPGQSITKDEKKSHMDYFTDLRATFLDLDRGNYIAVYGRSERAHGMHFFN